MRAWVLVFAHMAFHWRRTVILVGCLVIGCLVPLVLSQVMPAVQRQLERRARETPVVFGSQGGSLELVLHALYFRPSQASPLKFGRWQAFQQAGFERCVPLHVRFQAGDFPIVGTHLEYFSLRGRELQHGEAFGRLGDCVIGSEVARELELGVGDTLISSPRSFLNIAADYPLQLRIVGVLQPSSSADDEAVFVDLKTTWVIENLGHGHTEVATSNDPNLVLERSREGTVASAAVLPYTVVTDENLASFHFHGDMADFPITAIVLLDDRKRTQDLCAGLALKQNDLQVVFAPDAIRELLDVLLQVQNLLVAVSAFVGSATVLLFALVIGLSIQIRQQEMETLFKLGASRGLTMTMYGLEIFSIAALAYLFAQLLSWLIAWLWSAELYRWLLGL
ncbi:MAG: ABC transporter permease [Planctomycetaceae bacterium]|nr:ABC transporter permease [Planctomycetaceae bacterium]